MYLKVDDLDLGALLSYEPKGGVIQFMGHRILLIDAVAVGLLRTELINKLGISAARNILTRLGYTHGWLAAEYLSAEHPELLNDFRFGPALHTLLGFGTARDFKSNIDGQKHRVTCICENSYEAEQHLLQFGQSEESVCWTFTGWVSGYSSRVAGRQTYCIEHKCVAKGDAYCFIESRLEEDWGELIDQHLPFFHEKTIGGVLKSVTAKLRKAERRLWQLQKLFESDIFSPGIIARSEAMRHALDLAKRAAKVDTSVVVTGESGTGKELIARLIHEESLRVGRPFIAVNCSAVPEALLESEFFGHVKGAFTGADRDRVGLIEAANGGTIFLDEITEMPLGMQAKLLRALQERKIRRVGESISRSIDFRIIAASNRDLDEEIKAQRFRKDLYYRLCVIEIGVPPLRERTDDILPLARFCLDRLNERMGRSVEGFSPAAIEHLLLYSWPGNARELHNIIERAVALCTGSQIGLKDLPLALWRQTSNREKDDISSIEDIERRHILTALELTKGDKKLAAKKLKIGLTSLYRKLKKYGV
jgi:two-component system, NtrC family, response regulator HydG